MLYLRRPVLDVVDYSHDLVEELQQNLKKQQAIDINCNFVSIVEILIATLKSVTTKYCLVIIRE